MLGYVLWAIDRLARLSRTPAPGTASVTTAGSPPQAAQIMAVIPGGAGPAVTACPHPAGKLVLAPGSTIAMAMTMGYMLITMLWPAGTNRPAATSPGHWRTATVQFPALERGRDTRKPTRFAAWRMFPRLLSA